MGLILEEDTIQREPQTISVVPDVKPSVSLDNTGLTKAQRQHKGAVEQLFKEGKKVRIQYREMYPDLVQKYEGGDPVTAIDLFPENRGVVG